METTLYWITRLDDIKGMLGVTMFFAFVFATITLTGAIACKDKIEKPKLFRRKSAIISVVALITALTMFILTPTTKEAKEIYGIENVAKIKNAK